MSRDIIITPKAPRPAGAYSQAVRAGGMIFVAGQLPVDTTGTLVGPRDIRLQTRTVLAHIAAILTAAGSTLDKVVKTTVFLSDLGDYAGMNEAYAAVFADPYPARSTVETGRLPNGMLIEIDCIAMA